MGNMAVPAVISQREQLYTLLLVCHWGSMQANNAVKAPVNMMPPNCICSIGIIVKFDR